MKKMLLVFALLGMNAVYANDTELNQTLVRVINQLNATLPLLDEARDEVDSSARIQLHIDAFEGADGKRHAGVRDDIKKIRNALIDYINHPPIAPKTIKPLDLDFIGNG